MAPHDVHDAAELNRREPLSYRRPTSVHDVEREPHLFGRPAVPPSPAEPPPRPPMNCPTGEPLHSVWDEPALGDELLRDVPRDAGYSQWLADRRREMGRGRSWLMTLLLALAAGPWAVLGAFWGHGQTLFSALTLVVFAPAVEEIMKTALLAWAVERKPYWFKSTGQLLLCGIASGLAFASIENLLYLHVYIPNPPPGLVFWRWTVCVGLHVGCTTIATLGIVRIWRRTMRTGRRPMMTLAAAALVTAAAVHGVYNLGALIYG